MVCSVSVSPVRWPVRDRAGAGRWRGWGLALAAFVLALGFTDPGLALGPGDPVRGEQIFKKCKACHVAEQPSNKVGPHLFELDGREAGSLEGYKFSKNFRESSVVWTPATLDKFLANPKSFIPRNRMISGQLKDAQDRRDVIAYLGLKTSVDPGDLLHVRGWGKDNVRQIQQTLEMLGYGAGAPDGVVGKATLRALAGFLADAGLPADTSVNDIATANARAIYEREYGGDKAEWSPSNIAPPSTSSSSSRPSGAASEGEHVGNQCGQPGWWPGSGSYSSLLSEVMSFSPSTMRSAIQRFRDEDGQYDDVVRGYGEWLACVLSARQSYNPDTGKTNDERLDPSADREVRVVHDQCFEGRRRDGGYLGTNTCDFQINIYYCTPMVSGAGKRYWDCGMRYAIEEGWGHQWGSNMNRSVTHFWAACETKNIACNNRANAWIEEIDQEPWSDQDLNDIWASVDDSY